MGPFFGHNAYLADLLRFAQIRVKYDPAPDPPNVAEVARRLEAAFYQRYEQLSVSRDQSVGTQPVLQVRIAVEILRRYLTAAGLNSAPADGRYLQAAYETLLLNLGTSFEELRLVRVAADAEGEQARRSLAERLAIHPLERLSELLLDAPTEAALETVFGLVATTRDPFAGNPPQPRLLKWRVDSLRRAWQLQDAASQSDGERPLPAIDPDVIAQALIVDPTQVSDNALIASDIIPQGARQRARDLWNARKQQVAQLDIATRARIEQARRSQAPPAAFDTVVRGYLGSVDLEVELRQRTEGLVNQPPATGPLANLDLTALRRLVRIRRLAAATDLAAAEWADVAAIFVQWQKLGCYNIWLQEEQASAIHLGPDFFVLPGPGLSASLPRWRASGKARLAWEERLRSRSQQLRTAVQALQTAIDDTERVTLTDLRDELIGVLASAQNRDRTLIAEQLTRRMLVDFRNRDGRTITRIAHAIETLQALLFALRIGRPVDGDLPLNPARNWHLNLLAPYSEAAFDTEWQWMGSHTARTAIEYVKEYPDIYLMPGLRDDEAPQRPTAAFRQLMINLRSFPRLTPAQALQLANEGIGPAGPNNPYTGYLARLRAQGGLPPEVLPPFRISDQLPGGDYASRRQLVMNLENTHNPSHTSRVDFTTDTDPPQTIRIEDPHLAPAWFQEIFYFVPMAIALQLACAGEYLAALDWYQTVYAYQLPCAQRKIYRGLELEDMFWSRAHVTQDIWLRQELNPHYFARRRKFAYSRFTIMSIVQCLLDYADSEFTAETDESLPRARALYLSALELLGTPDMAATNPLADVLRLHAQLNLEKLRAGRNIAGMERPTSLQGSGADGVISNLPVIGSGGQLVAFRAAAFQPTPYRYSVLIERAKQLAGIAQQMEAAYLSAMEKRDAEAYSLLRARQDLEVSQATVHLQDLRVDEADMGVSLANLQQDRAIIQSQAYQKWLDGGLNEYEQTMIDSYQDAGEARSLAAYFDTLAQVAQAYTTAATAGAATAAASAGAFAVSVAAEARWGAQVVGISAETQAQVASIYATHERRKQEWQLQKSLADKDIEIGGQQIGLALKQLDMARQERDIASMRADQAQAAVEFLATRFTNAELYEWMSGVLGRVYSYFLQQATSIAQLAQNQLAFERQETPPAFIQLDYWQPPAEEQTNGNGTTTDRRGLTGSARLLQDIYKLDQYAFETNKRKLQISQTFSLARLFPFEFQQFRETGVLPFVTPLELFDRDFPGHYLRLIKRVRVSVVALVPPVQGIRASLMAGGISRVVVGPEVFQTLEIRRNPEVIAFTSPMNATGLFDLEAEGEMLLPFEGTGVDATWRLEMPRAANPFDFRSLADVLVTLEYTALHSFDYRQQVIRRLDPQASGECSFSLRDDFPDQWYDLRNPDQVDPARQMLITLEARRRDFPPNVEGLVVDHLLLYFVRTDCPPSEEGPCDEVSVSQLRRNGEPVGGTAVSIGGVISTRRANASQWQVAGTSPAGIWQVQLANTPEMRNRFKNGGIEDVLVVITYSGRTPPWPT